MPTAIDNGSTHIILRITIEPLLPQHGDECGEEGSSQTRVKNGLNVDDSGIDVTRWSEGGSDIGGGWSVLKRSFGDNHEEVVAHLCVIRLEVALNVDNESGRNCGEQTSLYPQMNTTTDTYAKRILTKINVVFKSSSYFFIKSRSYSSASRWNLS